MTNWEYLILILGSFGVAFILTTIIRKAFNIVIRKNTSFLRVDHTKFNFLKNSVTVIIYSFALFFVFSKIPALKDLGTALFASAGVFAAILGLASQKAFSNIISGIFIVSFKPFRVGDIIYLSNEQSGTVEDITLRHTVIRDFQNQRIIIPNHIISEETITNSSIGDERIRKHVEFNISYDSDVDLAEKIIVEEAMKHPLRIDARTEEEIQNEDPEILTRLMSLDEYSVRIRAYVWAKDFADSFMMTTDLYRAVKKRFDREGIEIPFPYRTIVMKDKK